MNYELSGKTRGRGSNPQKGKRGTLGSNTLLNFPDNLHGRSFLNYKSLINSYRDYFGLIMSNLYQSKPCPEPFTDESIQTVSTFYKLFKFNRKIRKLEPYQTLNIYNAGIKINELFLQLNVSKTSNLKLESVYPNLKRELKLS